MEGESPWISRLFRNTQPSTAPPSSMRRSLSCSSVPSQGETEFLVPRGFKRSQVGDLDDELDVENDFQRFLLSSRTCQVGRSSGSPKRPRHVQLSVSLDSSGVGCRTSSWSNESVVPQKIIRGFEGDDWTSKLESLDPLPYSSFEDQQSGKKTHNRSRPRKSSPNPPHVGRSLLFREFGEHKSGLASLLTPILTPANIIKSWQSAEGSASSNEGTVLREQQMRRRSSRRGDNEFVHEESVLSRPFYCYDRQQELQQQQLMLQQQQQASREWINRWSGSGEDNNNINNTSSEENSLRFRSAYVPSAEAMALVGKTSMIHANSSWSNSITSWHSDATSKDVPQF